ncbi:hypothetical protein [Mycobacterium canetti]|nr:hypothetical protein [Mycobacterium canetti]
MSFVMASPEPLAAAAGQPGGRTFSPVDRIRLRSHQYRSNRYSFLEAFGR